ncbi:MAG: restriction endonuclease subunit S [Clostridiales bacterium]|nr:restriction endonuclease subunit S [Clostridiales bacterium]
MGRAMKDSGVEWIGEIPEDWTLAKGKNLYSVYTGKLDANAEKADGEYPFFTCSMYPKRIDRYSFDCEALLVAGNGLVGFTQYYKGKFDAYQRTYVLSEFRNINPQYLQFYVSNNLPIEVAPNSVGSVIQFIKIGDLQNFHVVFPSLGEQQRIASFLDRQCTELDVVLEKTRSSIEEYKHLKQAVITQAVTKGVRGERPMKDSGIAWIGEIPAEWDIYRVANLYEERNEPGSDELPVLMVSIHSGVSDDEVKDEDRSRKALQSEDKSKYKRVYPGDLVYNMMRAWQGAFGAVRVDGLVSPAYVVAKPKVPLDTRYIEALFRTPSAIEEMRRYSYGITDFRLRLYWQYFKNIRFCLPDIEEQKEIASYIDDKCAEIDVLIAQKEQLLMELENYKKSLIYEYVTGKKEVPS